MGALNYGSTWFAPMNTRPRREPGNSWTDRDVELWQGEHRIETFKATH